jgi:hypothetical protein
MEIMMFWVVALKLKVEASLKVKNALVSIQHIGRSAESKGCASQTKESLLSIAIKVFLDL